MTKIYDQKYSTKVAFNTPIMLDMLRKKDINLVNDWFENGEPNKKLATAAIEEFIRLDWIEPIELLFSMNWLTQKGIITKGLTYLVQLRDPKYPEVEKWFFEKAFSNKHLSDKEQNSLRVSIIEMEWHYLNDYYWNKIFNNDIVFKGKTSQSLAWSAIYTIFPELYNNDIDESKIDLFKSRFDSILNSKNGFEIGYHRIVELIIKPTEKSIDFFWYLMESGKVTMKPKDLFLLASYVSLVFKSLAARFRQYDSFREKDVNYAKKSFDRALNFLIKMGLPDKVKFLKADFSYNGEYSRDFHHGYIDFTNVFAGIMSYPEFCLSHLQSVIDRNLGSYDNFVDTEFLTGVAIMHEPTKIGHDDYKYSDLTDSEANLLQDKFLKLKSALQNV